MHTEAASQQAGSKDINNTLVKYEYVDKAKKQVSVANL